MKSLRFCLLLVATATGCSKKPATYEVVGTLMLDGKPMPQAAVIFQAEETEPVQWRTSGVTDKDGRFRLNCDNGTPGAVAGQYRVTVIDVRPRRPKGAADPAFDPLKRASGTAQPGITLAPAEADSRVPTPYGDWRMTPLRQVVEPKPNDLTIPLTTKP